MNVQLIRLGEDLFLSTAKNDPCVEKRRFFSAQTFRATGFSLVLVFLAALAGGRAYAGSVGVVLNESLNESLDRITGSGHTAVYFSGICSDSPVRLRLCRPGEMGSVVSTYINIGEDLPYEWNAVPLNIYLYGVEDPQNRPIFASYKIKGLLEERYRAKYLSQYCKSAACQTSHKAEWREMVAATLIRGVYIFAVDTTEEQDRELIAEFNDSANKSRFNGATHNCADFARHVINTYFPDAVSRDYLNDFGMTSPKAVARTFTRYALRHPESNFRVMHFPQVPGTTKRSREVRAGTEQLYRSKLLIPVTIFAHDALPVVTLSYLFTGRFNPEGAFEKHPALEPDATGGNEQPPLVGTSPEWKKYRGALRSAVRENKDIVEPHEVGHFFKHLDEKGTASLDSNGAAWIQLAKNNETLKVGVSASNALSQTSSPRLSYELFLARTSAFLKSPKHRRETMSEFMEDWASLQRTSAAVNTIWAGNATPSKGMHPAIAAGGTD